MVNQIWKNIQLLREQNPLVYNMTNFVVMNNTANALLAVGASPLMTKAKPEISDLSAISNALVINIGTLDADWIDSMTIASAHFKSLSKPWVLDPVGAGASSYRTTTAQQLLENKPSVIRGNASEIRALANQTLTKSKGVDSSHSSNDAIESAKLLAKSYNTVVCVSGEIDFVVSANQMASVNNGHPLMAKVTGLGCTATALVGAFVGVNNNHFEAALSAVALLSVAGELAQKQSSGPGSLQVNLIDILYSISEKDFKATLKLELS